MALGILLASRYMMVKPHLSQARSQNEVQFSFHPQIEPSKASRISKPVAVRKSEPQIQSAKKEVQVIRTPTPVRKTSQHVMNAGYRKPSAKTAVIEIVNPKNNIKYEIQPGDRLDKISNKFFGTHHRWSEIVSANPGLDPSKIRPGQVIMIPSVKTDLPKQESVYLKTHAQNKRPYKVQEKDLLGSIAERELGSVKHLPKILALNPGLDPKLLRPGQTIYLPTSIKIR
jgi:nucleoid-associated protein YgaU